MPLVVEARLRVLAFGIRPTFAAECGAPQRGTVDILDAHGISGWQIGIRQLISEAAVVGVRDERLLDWARVELEADAVRWHHLAAYVTTLRRAVAGWSATHHCEDETLTFWRVWRRNLARAHALVVSSNLLVSPMALAVLHDVVDLVHRDAGPYARNLPDLVVRLRDDSSARLRPETSDPPPLVLREYRAVLTTALSSAPR